MPVYDFHTHTFFSDGALLPMELIRRAIVNGYAAMAITDHASASNIEELVEKVTRDCELALDEWQFRVLPGVELTHCPPASIARLAARAKAAGAKIVVIHGETLVEPVPPGTNRASVECPDVDILGHPGLLTETEANLARENNVFLELTSRRAIVWVMAIRLCSEGQQGRSFWSIRTRIRRVICTRKHSPAQ